jgi:hypothetical protein
VRESAHSKSAFGVASLHGRVALDARLEARVVVGTGRAGVGTGVVVREVELLVVELAAEVEGEEGKHDEKDQFRRSEDRQEEK